MTMFIIAFVLLVISESALALVVQKAFQSKLVNQARHNQSKSNLLKCNCKSSKSGCRQVSTHLNLFGGFNTGAKAGKKNCKLCKGQGTIICKAGECVRGIDKKNGAILERWTCKVCKGFGLVPCKCSGSGGLTPEQSGER